MKASLILASCLVGSAVMLASMVRPAQAAAPQITAFSSTGGTSQNKDNDQDIMYLVAQGDTLTFSATVDEIRETSPIAIRTYEFAEFKPLNVSGEQTADVFISDELERTPRHYLQVVGTVKAEGAASVALILVDVLRREYRGATVNLVGGKPTEISVDVAQAAGHPVSLLRGVKLQHQGAPVEVSGLRFVCEDELLPRPDVVVSGPLDHTSIQKALNSLGTNGGVVYIPAGKYVFGQKVTIPADNVTIYGDGRDTVIYCRSIPIMVWKRKNVRITRLHFQSRPITDFRGYGGGSKYDPPEDKEKKDSVTNRGLELHDCQNVRVDHCEIELFGLSGMLVRDGAENLIDHCYFHENFRAGYGYGVDAVYSKALYIEDNNFENNRHGLAGNGKGDPSPYIARFNRLVKDATVVKGWKQSDFTSQQIAAHEIDVHASGGRVYVHDNYVAMQHGNMAAGAVMRGNNAWLYRNVFENMRCGILREKGDGYETWTWENSFVNCKSKEQDTIGQKPPDFKEFAYPYSLNRLGWWPGAKPGSSFAQPKSDSLCAGPADPQLLREVANTAFKVSVSSPRPERLR
ncbi:MAG: right-handed parallel beta-helix repeat-containing protein [Verrucomicrobia bacterium]|nr:right-handed parallel beta-helix repeat-containing protein [Verrucomicrobiota bacterium]MCG2678784.1 right-handed parallel beta-helix repeat-containing protein [Kiritimatiellia bacterium]MBU4247442.1 right-handed parallel beta-helix repeat-containing protein [Verrucomicrobiota bacterium]MBU4289973.1 right-handed parallel beta-helix repeat-containing protein [Verrucomicrobiota bacterium]MBU4430362.1 right-handed parallel beta-helix repeat-containing protein [Verrucomicrobiota bacterium]